MKKMPIVVEYLRFLRDRKLYWLIPIVLILLMMGLMIVLFEGSALAPFIYTIF